MIKKQDFQDMNEMTRLILPVLREAGKAIMEIYRNPAEWNVEVKGDRSPVTNADKRSNEIICRFLEHTFPDIPIISEETRQATYDQRRNFERLFLLDPLDGTKEFLHRNGEFTINLAYIENERTACGYISIPAQDRLFFAEKHQGAFEVKADSLIRLSSSPFYLRDPHLKVVASRRHRDELTERIIASLDRPEIVSVGSALKFLLIAEGKAHFYPRLAHTMEWDTAAAQCILEESGGAVIRYDTGEPVMYNKPDLLSPFFIAFGAMADPEYLADLLDKIRTR